MKQLSFLILALALGLLPSATLAYPSLRESITAVKSLVDAHKNKMIMCGMSLVGVGVGGAVASYIFTQKNKTYQKQYRQTEGLNKGEVLGALDNEVAKLNSQLEAMKEEVGVYKELLDRFILLPLHGELKTFLDQVLRRFDPTTGEEITDTSWRMDVAISPEGKIFFNFFGDETIYGTTLEEFKERGYAEDIAEWESWEQEAVIGLWFYSNKPHSSTSPNHHLYHIDFKKNLTS